MKTIKINIITAVCIAVCSTLLSFSSFAQEHVTMSVRNITANSNTIEYDLYIVNDGATSLKLSACSYGVNFDEAILNGGTLTYSYRENSRGNDLSGLRNFSVAKTKTGDINQARMTTAPSTFEKTMELMPERTYKVGHFKMTNSVNWTRNSNPALSLQALRTIGLTTTQVIAYIGSDKKLTALTPNLKTVSLEVEKSPILNADVEIPYQTEITKNSMNVRSTQNGNTGINESQINVYPNPAMKELNIDMDASVRGVLIINIADMSGRTIKQIQTNLTEGMNKINIDVSELLAGVYTIQLNDAKDIRYTQKFVKQ